MIAQTQLPIPPDARPDTIPLTPRTSPQRSGPRRGRRFGTAVRLAALHAGILAAILAAVVVSLTRTFAGQSNASTSHLLAADVRSYQRAADARPAGQSLAEFSRGYLRTQALPEGEILLVGFPGRSVLGSAGSGPLAGSELIAPMLSAAPAVSVSRTVRAGATTYDVLAVPVHAGSTVATLVVAADEATVNGNESRVLRLALIEALIALIAGSVAGYLLLRSLLRRIGGITQTAAELGQGELDRRLGDQGTDDEVGDLAATFDAMADRVAAAMAAQRQLLADVSHQLRTPLTVARGHLEVLERTGSADSADVHETIGVVVGEIDHMTALVERLLMLGRVLEPDFATPQPVDLRSFMADLHSAANVIAPRQWGSGPVPDLTLSASLDKLRGALLNLIDNAVNATAEGDRIDLGAARRDDGWILLSVSDSGPGIPLHQREAVLDRFGRPGAAGAKGTGLGLAIVKAVAEAHGGHVEIATAGIGGARVTIALPPDVVITGPEG